MLLHSSPHGNPTGNLVRTEPVTMEFLTSLFSEALPVERTLSGFWTELYEHPQERARRFTRDA